MLPLQGTKVVEFAAIGPVPWCGQLLAELGADVVRIDRPGAVDPATDTNYTKGGRRVLVLDLKNPRDREAALSLVAAADVLVEGLRPGVMERLGLGPADCHAANPRLVYARMTGWGQDGPLAQRAGHDINYIALSGALHTIGAPERPIPPVNLLGDFGGGSTFLAIGTLAALLQARSTGQGTVVDAAMLDGSAYLMSSMYSRHANGLWRDARASNEIDGGAPWYDVYAAGDGKFMAVGAVEKQFYSLLVAGLGLDEAGLPPREDRANWPALRRAFAERFLTKPRDEWARIFEPTDACVTPVLSLAEAPLHPHNRARALFQPWQRGNVPMTAPRLGAQTPAPHAPSQPATAGDVLAAWSAPSRTDAS